LLFSTVATDKSITMAATRTIPRFLLPQTSWTQATNTYRVSANHISRLQNAQSDSRRLFQSSARENSALNQGRILQNVAAQTATVRAKTARAGRRQFSVTTRRAKDHHFDTLKFVQRLQDEGFSEEQAVAMMKVLGDVVEERLVHIRTLDMNAEWY